MEEGQVEILPTCTAHKESTTIHELLECYNVTEEDQEGEDPRNVQVPQAEGECDVVGPTLEFDAYVNPLSVHKVNIGIKAKPKFATLVIIGTMRLWKRLQTYCTNIRISFRQYFQR